MAQFDESKHPRKKNGEFAPKEQRDAEKMKKDIYKRHRLAFFCRKSNKNSNNKEIIDGIKNIRQVRAYHEYKIAHPWEFYPIWNEMPPREREGRLNTWEKEIRNHTQCIKDRKEELKKRGIDFEE